MYLAEVLGACALFKADANPQHSASDGKVIIQAFENILWCYTVTLLIIIQHHFEPHLVLAACTARHRLCRAHCGHNLSAQLLHSMAGRAHNVAAGCRAEAIRRMHKRSQTTAWCTPMDLKHAPAPLLLYNHC